jgi:hypothetical protein
VPRGLASSEPLFWRSPRDPLADAGGWGGVAVSGAAHYARMCMDVRPVGHMCDFEAS